MTLLNKESIFAAPDLKTERLTVEEWGGELIISEMGGETMVEFYDLIFPPKDEDSKDSAQPKMSDARFHATLIAFCVVDKDGKRVFDNDDIPALARKNRAVLKRVFDVADRLNIVSVAARKAAEKNSEGEEAGGEPYSSSPESSASLPGGTSSKR